MTPDPTIILGATSFLLLIAVGFLMLHAAGLRRERDQALVELDGAEKTLQAKEDALDHACKHITGIGAKASRDGFIADGVRSLVAQADGQQ
jgi:hypothetical protein